MLHRHIQRILRNNLYHHLMKFIGFLQTVYFPLFLFLGAYATAIPGEVAGMWNLHQKFGELKWEDLVSPSIKIAEEGLRVNKALATAIQSVKRKVDAQGMDMLPGLK